MSATMRGFKGIQTDNERSTTATASCPLIYEEQALAILDLLCGHLRTLDDVRRNTSLVIKGIYPVPMEVRDKVLVQIIDLNTIHVLRVRCHHS